MTSPNTLQELNKSRTQIARRVRELRTARKWTQQELARHLDLSQSRLSELEHGDGSFTAEQLLKILALFNVPATHFAPSGQKRELDLQNALARHGASHLHESTDVLPSEQLEEMANLVREALITQSPRQLTALAPVLVRNADRLGVVTPKLVGTGLERRLGWVIENTLEAVRTELPSVSRGPSRQQYRRAEVVLDSFLRSSSQHFLSTGDPSAVDLLDPIVVTKRTLEEVRASSSPISQRWRIVTTLQPEDFAAALRAARANG
jgi:transcriptional regulator with XRE-family HTH domain